MILPAGDLHELDRARASGSASSWSTLEAEAVGTAHASRPGSPSGPRTQRTRASSSLRRGRDDDREGAREGPHRPLRRERRASGPRRSASAATTCRSIAHLKMLQSLSGKLVAPQRRRADRADDRRRAPAPHRLPQLPRLPPRDDDLVPVAFRGDLISADPGDPREAAPDTGRSRNHRPRRRDR